MIEASDDPQLAEDLAKVQPIWKWIIAVIFLAITGLTTGSVNLYPSQQESIKNALHISNGVSTFMLTGGVMIMYITLPAGLFMDHFGGNITLLISAIITVISYIFLAFCTKPTWLFITFYLLMAFGSSSLFIVCLQLVLSRAPANIKGASASIIGASLSMSFGMFLEIYKVGGKAFHCSGDDCVFSSFRLVGLIVICMIVLGVPVSYFFYRGFPSSGNQPSTRVWSIFADVRLYIFLFTMLVTVFDGMVVLEGGDHIWKTYGDGFDKGASDWGIAFSVINCVMTILLSILIDFLIAKFEFLRMKIFYVLFVGFSVLLVIIGLVFKLTNSQSLFGVFFSMLGMVFGIGLTQIPTLVSDAFGNDKYGFAFGVVQVGSIFSSASAMPILLKLGKAGITATFFVLAAAHIVLGLASFLVKRGDDYISVA